MCAQMDAGKGQYIQWEEHQAHRQRCGAREQLLRAEIQELEKKLKDEKDRHARQLKDIKQNYNRKLYENLAVRSHGSFHIHFVDMSL
jgi:molecular chaperone GrpE (heat shock protein)